MLSAAAPSHQEAGTTLKTAAQDSSSSVQHTGVRYNPLEAAGTEQGPASLVRWVPAYPRDGDQHKLHSLPETRRTFLCMQEVMCIPGGGRLQTIKKKIISPSWIVFWFSPGVFCLRWLSRTDVQVRFSSLLLTLEYEDCANQTSCTDMPLDAYYPLLLPVTNLPNIWTSKVATLLPTNSFGGCFCKHRQEAHDLLSVITLVTDQYLETRKKGQTIYFHLQGFSCMTLTSVFCHSLLDRIIQQTLIMNTCRSWFFSVHLT